MKMLVLGGTTFVGPALVELLLEDGHDVTLFNRGKTNPDLFPSVRRLVGDRTESDLSALEGESFDVVFDINAYFPRVVREMLETISCKRYVFVSTISVYEDFKKPNADETHTLATTDDPESETVGANYGALKVLCENEVVKGHSHPTIIRPGLIVGPRDPTDRFTYWIARVAQGGTMLCPGSPEEPIQYIDVQNVAEFMLHCVENRIDGVFNLVTPANFFTLGDLLSCAEAITGVSPEKVWLSAEQLEEFELRPWVDFPAWAPQNGELAGLTKFSSDWAVKQGFGFSDISDTVEETWDWFQTREDQTLKAGLSPEREKEILEKLS